MSGDRKDEGGGMPADLSPMLEGAIAARELFESWVEAGFTESQAIRLLAAFIVENNRPGGEDAS